MNSTMATRNPASVKLEKDGSTDFVMHKSQQTIFAGIQKKIVDYTEHKLVRYANNIQDVQQRLVLMALITDYRDGKVAIAWQRGKPVYLRVQKDSYPTPTKPAG